MFITRYYTLSESSKQLQMLMGRLIVSQLRIQVLEMLLHVKFTWNPTESIYIVLMDFYSVFY